MRSIAGIGRRADKTVRITTAGRSRTEDVRDRERRYLVSMGIRSVCFVLAVLFAGHWFMWAFLAAAFLLPTFAVVAANAGAAPDPSPSPEVLDPRVRAIGDGSGARPTGP